ncbi:MAG: MFS transporter [Deltaproteobacteria bacterium]|nr:MFS transporter [Deltaproteobacteria bacterium]
MFAAMYSTQAILPEIGKTFLVSPSRAGLTISAAVLALSAAAWLWGPFSDRFGRRRSMVLASALLVVPSIGVALAPSFPLLLLARSLQGLCMPGLLTVGLPYVIEVSPESGGKAMGTYVTALVFGGLIGRLGVGLLASAVGWRWAVGSLVPLPLAGAILLAATLPQTPPAAHTPRRLEAIREQLNNGQLLLASCVACALFFNFVGVFSYVVFRLQARPFGLGTGTGSLIFVLWLLGTAGPAIGRLVDRFGWQRLAAVSLAVASSGLLITLPNRLPTVVLGLALMTLAMFTGLTAAQLGVARSTTRDRGTASAIYISLYYAAGALGGYLPGLAWQAWRWEGVVLSGLGALGAASLAVAAAWRKPR